MNKVTLYSYKGTKQGLLSIPKNFSEEGKVNLLSQVVHVYRERMHSGLAKAKTRSEVQHSTRKIYKQKGTGGARHGAKSAPIFVGGGAAHGPKALRRTLTLPRKIKNKALRFAIFQKVSENQLVVIKNLSLIKKTNDLEKLLDKISVNKNRTVIILSKKSSDVSRVARNINYVKAFLYENLNAYEVFLAKKIIFDAEILKPVSEKKPKTSNLSKDKKKISN